MRFGRFCFNYVNIAKQSIWLLIVSIILCQISSPVLAGRPDQGEEAQLTVPRTTLNSPPILQNTLSADSGMDNALDTSEYVLYLPLLFGQPESNQFFLDLQDRDVVDSYFTENYLNAEAPAIEWTGNLLGCDPGSLSPAYQAAVLKRINFFRRMAGVPDTVLFNEASNLKAQAAALMMARNKKLDHTPKPAEEWLCYTDLGYFGASSSNLALGAYGWVAINMYMLDPGTGNGEVGHRRWILYPQTQEMGNGDIPPQPDYPSANALVVFDNHYTDPRPQTRENYVAWPPPGYVPYQIVFPRWSFSFDDADFSSATVTMSYNGSNIPLVIETPVIGYGENTLVWIPSSMDNWENWPKPTFDMLYTVNVQNVYILSEPHNFRYDVTVFDPQ